MTLGRCPVRIFCSRGTLSLSGYHVVPSLIQRFRDMQGMHIYMLVKKATSTSIVMQVGIAFRPVQTRQFPKGSVNQHRQLLPLINQRQKLTMADALDATLVHNIIIVILDGT